MFFFPLLHKNEFSLEGRESVSLILCSHLLEPAGNQYSIKVYYISWINEQIFLKTQLLHCQRELCTSLCLKYLLSTLPVSLPSLFFFSADTVCMSLFWFFPCLFYFCSTRGWIQDLTLIRQVLYHLSIPSDLLLLFLFLR